MTRMLRLTGALLAAALLLTASTAAAEPETTSLHLAGTIGGLAVRVELSVTSDAVSGTYVYEGAKPAFRSIVDALSLAGRVDASGAVELTESASDLRGNEKTTGTWRGRLERGPAGARLTGTWIKPGGGTLPIALGEIGQAAGGRAIEKRRFVEPDARFAKIVSFEYPQIAGSAAFNAAVERFVAGEVAEFKKFILEDDALDRPNAEFLAFEATYEVTAATPDLVSVVFTVYTNFGGAYPSSRQEALTFDVRRGRVLDLGDLFKDKRAYARQLAARVAPLVPDEPALSIDAARFDAWYVSQNGLWLVYPVAHVAGDYASVYLPFGLLRDSLDPAGPASSFVVRK